jgi:hypothetical protein
MRVNFSNTVQLADPQPGDSIAGGPLCIAEILRNTEGLLD